MSQFYTGGGGGGSTTHIDSFTTDVSGPVTPDGAGNVALTGATTIFTNGSVAHTVRTEVQGTNHALFVGKGSNTAAANLATGTALQVLQSGGASADPTWSTATYPATTTANDILYSSSTNVVGQISTLQNGVLVTNNSSVPSLLANSGTAGFVLTANSGAPPSWQATAVRYPITPYVVGPVGQAGYQTIQSAVTAAGNAGGGLVFIQPGSYNENIVFPNSIVNLMGAGYQLTEIVGTMTPPTTTALQIFNLRLTADEKWIDSGLSGSSVIEVNNCAFTILGGSGLNLPNWAGNIFVNNCITDESIDDGFCNINNGTIYVNNSTVGRGTSQITNINGTMVIRNSTINSLVNINGTLQSIGNTYNHHITIASSGTGYSLNDTFVTPGEASIRQNSTGTFAVANTVINSSANPCITGTGSGAFQITDISFLDVSVVDPSLNLTYGTNLTGNLNVNGGVSLSVTVVTNALSPYAVVDTDDFIACDGVGGAITINLPATPLTGRTIAVCDSTGHSAANNITVSGNGHNITLGGSSAASKTISTNYQLSRFTFNGSLWNGA